MAGCRVLVKALEAQHALDGATPGLGDGLRQALKAQE